MPAESVGKNTTGLLEIPHEIADGSQSATVEASRQNLFPHPDLGRSMDFIPASFPCQEGFKMKAGFGRCR